MATRYLIDTNCLIDAQMNNISPKGIEFLKEAINQNFTVSFITYIEFLGYKNITKSSEEFIALANVVETNPLIIETCINIRKQHKTKLPDAIIAATALANNFTLITRNTNDFKNIDGLNMINPYNL